MSLDLETVRTTGRARKDLIAEIERELTVDDLAELGSERGTKPTALKRLGERHHAVARLLASGMKPGEVAAELNYSSSRISILQDDPTFQELVQFYKQEVVEPAFRGFHEKLSSLGETAIDVLADRIEDDPEGLSSAMLHDIIKMSADRTGFGPSSTNTNVNVHIDLASRLQRAREAAKAAMAPRVIEGKLATG